MKTLWQRVASSVAPGVRLVLALMVATYLATVIGTLTSAYKLSPWLVLTGPAFWHGQVWLALTYVLLPAGLMELLINGLMIAWLGGCLERLWSRGGFWTYCLVVTVGTGLVKVLIQPSVASPLVGSTPLMLGLLVAWMRLWRQGGFSLRSILESPIQVAAWVLAGVSVFMMVANAGLANALVLLAGGLIGWLYLSIRSRFNASCRIRPCISERMARLEL